MASRSLSPEELNAIMRIVIGEMDDESEDVQKAFAWVIWNRWHHERVPQDLTSVCQQFSCWKDQAVLDHLVANSDNRQEIGEWLRELFQGEDPTNGADYYYSPDNSHKCKTQKPQGAVDLRQPPTVIGKWEFSKWLWEKTL